MSLEFALSFVCVSLALMNARAGEHELLPFVMLGWIPVNLPIDADTVFLQSQLRGKCSPNEVSDYSLCVIK